MAIISTSMLLPIPVVGVTSGPEYASNINNCLTIIDTHDHTFNNGSRIPTAGLNINADLDYNGYNVTGVRTLRFESQGSVPSEPSDLGCMYEFGNDLYYINGAGQPVQITNGGSIAGTTGSITGLVSPASASYGSSTFTFRSGALIPANLDGASVVLRNLVASSNGYTVNAPAAMTQDYSVSMPLPPASTLPIVMDNAGAMSAQQISLAMIEQAVKDFLLPPPASVLMYAGSAAPTGYLLCDGTAVSRTTYAALFSIIGITHGSGDGSTTFNIPDYRGRFIRGVDGAAGRDPDNASRTAMNTGGNVGNNVGSIQGFALQQHTHFSPYLNSAGGPSVGWTGGNGVVSYNSIQTSAVSGATVSTETRPLNANVNFIIKT